MVGRAGSDGNEKVKSEDGAPCLGRDIAMVSLKGVRMKGPRFCVVIEDKLYKQVGPVREVRLRGSYAINMRGSNRGKQLNIPRTNDHLNQSVRIQ